MSHRLTIEIRPPRISATFDERDLFDDWRFCFGKSVPLADAPALLSWATTYLEGLLRCPDS